MTARWGAAKRIPLTDRGWLVLVVTPLALLAVFTVPRLICEAAVYVMEAF